MWKREEDTESSAQLLDSHDSSSASSDSGSSHNGDYGWEIRNGRISRYTQALRRRLPSLSLPNWLPINKINRRCLTIAIVLLVTLTLLIFNPYFPRTDSSQLYKLPPEDTNKTTIPILDRYLTYEPPKLKTDKKFCTTWPVDDEGQYHLRPRLATNETLGDSFAPNGGWQKPKDIKIIGMVFYGRKQYVDILDCYLQQNLAVNGGYFDEIWFMAHTKKKDDIAWVEDLVQRIPHYRLVGKGVCEGKKYSCMWNYAVEDKTIYVKIDDDIVYIHQDAIPQLVHTRIALPHPYAVSANLVNSPMTGMQHYHYGAIHPYMPDPYWAPSRAAVETWRPSEMGEYPADKKSKIKKNYNINSMSSPYRGHPWLLLSQDHYENLKTPMGRYDQERGGKEIAFGPAWRSWGLAAQQHYSLLHNLERNQMDRYHFGRPITYPYPAATSGTLSSSSSSSSSWPINATAIVGPESADGPGGEQTYDTGYTRYNLNFIAVWGADIRAQLPIADDDEKDITSLIPQRTGRPFLIDTRAVVSHYGFVTQQDGVSTTDILDRYRALANEAVCVPANRKTPWNLRCDGFEVREM
ncbi:hypothetical protein F4778DRAFT_372114 [Xylariomycetidae sp. FL2044]|nr:hypothetical protein F4778DRAFT_372114 [Xylariomycetidae sp. FL2044]